MEPLIIALATELDSSFNGETVGLGGTYGTSCTKGPFTIQTTFHQWDNITYPNIGMQVVQEVHVGHALECCAGGVMELTVSFRVSIDSKLQGYSIGSALVEAIRTWLCTMNESEDLTGDDYTYVAMVGIPDTYWLPNGPILDFHVVTKLRYIRQTPVP